MVSIVVLALLAWLLELLPLTPSPESFSAAAALSASSLASSAAFSCSAFAWASLRLLGLCQCVLGGFLLGLELGLGLLELGLVLLEFGLHLVELFDLVDARARDLVGVLAGGDELAQALRVDQEAHDGVGALLVLIQIAHGGARLGLLIGKFGFDLLDACLVSVDLLLQILELGAGFVVGTRGGFDFLLGSGKLILRCLRGGIGCDGGRASARPSV